MDKWRHLFTDGEFAERRKIVSGLTLRQATHRLSEQSHTIYEELWHTARWQRIVVERDEELYKTWQAGEVYPSKAPPTEEEWQTLVRDFLAGLDRALEWAASPDKLRVEVDPGVTMEDVLHSLAVHNAHHLGKIVAIRQALGAWPSAPNAGETDETNASTETNAPRVSDDSAAP
jgi:uncharacterized damage-inducible protein DinB